jgi:IclR family transcriptional regulator, KDG regulon repressor
MRNDAHRLHEPSNNHTVQSVGRALTIFETVCESEQPLSLAKISARVGLPKPTTFRLLQALCQRSLVQQDVVTRAYYPGIKIFEWSNAVTRKLNLRTQALPELRELSQLTNETVHLAILDDAEVIYIDKEESQQTIRMFSAIGKRGPAYCTGVGKALLAHLPSVRLNRVLASKNLNRFTPRTITTANALKRELAQIRERGYAIDNAEHEANIYCIACPIYDHEGEVIAAMSLTIPGFRLPTQGIESFAPLVREYSNRISRKMGFVAPSSSPTKNMR